MGKLDKAWSVPSEKGKEENRRKIRTKKLVVKYR